jgi:hypothetical protein
MAGTDAAPRAHVSLVCDGRTVELGPISAVVPCDLALVDHLLRFELAARRLGWHVRLRDVDADLTELFDLVGLERAGDQSSR